ncbi:MAG: 23S rRNA pseudouridine(2605) synthase RluB [Gammaproteobacteria bacterium]
MNLEPVERLQKLLARAGLGSRREIEAWIDAGRVSVNGKRAVLGVRACTDDRINIDGRPVNLLKSIPDRVRVLAYYKPEGQVCTRKDPEGRPTVFAGLPPIDKGRWLSIGRLDINSSGLLLFSNDGELANRLLHPSGNLERKYAVRVLGRATEKQLNRMLNGVALQDGAARFTDIVDSGGEGANHWYHVVIMEGRNREVRRLWESQGLAVSRLIRIRFGPYILPRSKKPGQFWDLNKKDLNALLQGSRLKVQGSRFRVQDSEL